MLRLVVNHKPEGPRRSRAARLWDRWGEALLGDPRTPWVITLVAMVLTSPSLTVGLGLDDLFHQLMLREDPGIAGLSRRPLDLFSFATGDPDATLDLMDEGVFPWWSDPHAVLAFFRPLSSASHWLDHSLWPDRPALMHLHSLLWFGVLVLVAGSVYRELDGRGGLAGLSLLLFALDDARGPVVGWVANRNAIIALALALPALVAHRRLRRDGYCPGAWIGPLSFAAGLLAGETAVIVCAYLFAYAVFLDRGPFGVRFGSLIPYALVLVGWRALHLYLGYGATGSGLYVDPGRDPLGFIEAAVTRLPVLLVGQFALPWADFWEVYPLLAPRLQSVVLILAGLLVATLVLLLAPLWRADRSLRFWSIGTLLALVPVCATFPHDRLLVGAGIGGAAVLARLFTALLEGDYPKRSRWVSVIAVALAIVHLGLGPLLLPFRARGVAAVNARLAPANDTIASTPEVSTQTVVLVNPPLDPFAAYLPIYLEAEGRPRPRRLLWLATGVTELRIERVDDRSLRLRPAAGFLSSSSQLMLRSRNRPMQLGETVWLSDATFQVTDLTSDGRPAEVVVRFSVPLEDRQFRWLQWGRHGYVPFSPPKVGQAVVVPAVDMRTALLH